MDELQLLAPRIRTELNERPNGVNAGPSFIVRPYEGGLVVESAPGRPACYVTLFADEGHFEVRGQDRRPFSTPELGEALADVFSRCGVPRAVNETADDSL